MNNIKSDYFYTDSNGRQMIQRERNNYAYNNDSIEPVASNYYPVTSRITIKNSTKDLQMSVVTDRSQGGSSLKDGEIELLVRFVFIFWENLLLLDLFYMP